MAISIEIRNGYVYLVEAKVSKDSITIKRTHSFEYPDSWVDSQGIREVEDFALLLSENLKENGFKDRAVTICVNNPSIVYRELQVPRIDEKRMPFIVRGEMMNALNLTPNYIMDYVVLDEVEGKEEGTPLYRVLAVAMPEEAIESYIELMKKAKLSIKAIDSATNSIIKLVQEAEVITEDQVIVADVGNGHLRLYLFEDHKYVLSRNTRLMTLTDDNKEEIVTIVEENINKMIQFSYTRANSRGVKRIILMGLDELLPSIQKNTFENLIVPCEIFSKPHFVELAQGNNFLAKYVNALGALVRK